jgi:hypothetical protein
MTVAHLPLAVGGLTQPLLSLSIFLTLTLSIGLSVVVLLKGIQSYRRLNDPALLLISLGIVLLSGAPILVNVGLATAGVLRADAIATLVNVVRLVGLACVLYVIYQTRGGTA